MHALHEKTLRREEMRDCDLAHLLCHHPSSRAGHASRLVQTRIKAGYCQATQRFERDVFEKEWDAFEQEAHGPRWSHILCGTSQNQQIHSLQSKGMGVFNSDSAHLSTFTQRLGDSLRKLLCVAELCIIFYFCVHSSFLLRQSYAR